MCGIIGYVGPQPSSPILVEGLRRLEYRGYDSAGIAVIGDEIQLRRAVGKLHNLDAVLRDDPIEGRIGIGHTRWATHGRPTEPNAHPHVVGRVAVVHNGIIENHLALREKLSKEGCEFASETDTEIFAWLIDAGLSSGLTLREATREAISKVEGSYAIAVLDAADPERLIVAKQQSPLILGLNEGERFCASDIPAILPHTRQVIYLQDGDLAELTAEGHVIYDAESGQEISRPISIIQWSAVAAEKGGYKHFMLKEIHEQGRAIADTIAGRASLEQADVFFDDFNMAGSVLASLNRIVIIACGTSWHAGLVGRHYLESATRIPVQVEQASEFRYRDPIVDRHTLVIAISQSGETADTLGALKEAKRRGARCAAIVNVIDSSIARAAGQVVYTHAGPEIGVASTKAFTTQMVALYLMAVGFGRRMGRMNVNEARRSLEALIGVPGEIARAIELNADIRQLANDFKHASSALYLGRGLLHPIALEGALKLKEISYVHAEGHAAGEMKHGPIALIDEHTPTIVVAPQGPSYDKTASNLQEILARHGPVIAVGDEDDAALKALCAGFLPIPKTTSWTAPIVSVVPLQLLAYHIADIKGTDIDQPRNLAKSVTVE